MSSEIARQWDERYASSPRVFRHEPDESLAEFISTVTPGRALDLGAGEGRNSLFLAEHGWSVVAVDVSKVGLARLTEEAAQEKLHVETVVAEMGEYLKEAAAGDERFDLVVVCYVHPEPSKGSEPPVSQRRSLLEAASGVLGPGGHLFVAGHHISSLGQAGPPDPDRLYREEDLEGISPDLETIRLWQRSGASDVEHHGTDVVLWAVKKPADR